MIIVLDIIALASALVAAWMWFLSSQRRLRRMQRDEEIDVSDLNRLVVTINRSQILNARAAMASAVSALSVAMRFLFDLL